MRFLAFTVLLATSLPAAEFGFKTGQGARLVVGQTTFTAQEPGASDTLLGAVSGVAYANNMLMVTDSNRLNAEPLNHRVLLFKNLSSQFPGPADELPVNYVRCQVCVGKADLALGQRDLQTAEQKATNRDTLRVPVAIATDGSRIVVADTDNNRVLIWNQIPATSGVPADVVVGQADFEKAVSNGFNPTSQSLKGPQGVWLQNGKLFVADTGNNRVLIYNTIPTSNHATADIVLGQTDMTSFVEIDLTKAQLEPQANTLLTPVSVTSDGIRLYVADLGHNRVLIWNNIPTQNQQPADLVIGQPDMQSATANNSVKIDPGSDATSIADDTITPVLCESTGTNSDGRPIYPPRCAATLDFPRFALSDGRMLFIADGGNDRILVFNQIPTANGARADAVLGQINDQVNLVSDSAFPEDVASAGTVRTPLALAWDGLNLYVSDPFNRRVMVFTMAEQRIPRANVRNAASLAVYAIGTVAVSGETAKDEEVTITIGITDAEDKRQYKYTVKEGDGLDDVVVGLAELINAGAGDPQVLASPNPEFLTVILTSRVGGEVGNLVPYSAAAGTDDKIIVAAGGSTLQGGEEATKIAPGALVSIVGEQLSDVELSVPGDSQLPHELGGVEVYFDGIRTPLISVSPTKVNAQIPVDVYDAQSVNAYVRTVHADGRVVASNAVAVPIVQFNPGIFAEEGTDPRPAIAEHGSSYAGASILIGGQTKTDDQASVVIQGSRKYTYTVKAEDVPAEGQPARLGYEKIRDGLIALINQDPEVRAEASGIFATRILLFARAPGPEGNGIKFSVETDGAGTAEAVVTLSVSGTELCCASQGGALITEENPAVAGQIINVYATGLGLPQPDAAREAFITGVPYNGPEVNEPIEFVSALAGGRTANVLSAALEQGKIGIYKVVLELNSGLPTNPVTQLTIAQGFQVSNIVSIPVYQPNPE
jgi:uncharacterized protein (TIGR03437 family)